MKSPPEILEVVSHFIPFRSLNLAGKPSKYLYKFILFYFFSFLVNSIENPKPRRYVNTYLCQCAIHLSSRRDFINVAQYITGWDF